MTGAEEGDPLEALRARRNRLAEKLVARAHRAKRHNVEQDLEHIRQLSEVLDLADGINEEPRVARKRLPLMVGGLALLVATLFLMWRRAESGEVQLDVWASSMRGTLAPSDPTELEFGLTGRSVSVDSLGSVDARGRFVRGESLYLGASEPGALRLQTVTAPAASELELDASLPGRLGVTVRPKGAEDVVSVRLAVGQGARVEFDETGELASELERSSRSSLLTCLGLPGRPVTVVLDLARPETEEVEQLEGLSGLELGSLRFLTPFQSSLDGALRVKSSILGGSCTVAGAGPDATRIPRAGVLAADAWAGYVSAIESGADGLHLEWYGSARNLRAGHPSAPEPLLPVLFQKWFGRSPRAYISLVMVYVSLLPIIGILRGLLGQSRFNPSLDMEEPG